MSWFFFPGLERKGILVMLSTPQHGGVGLKDLAESYLAVTEA